MANKKNLSKKSVERLLILADYMDAIKPKKFDLSSFYDAPEDDLKKAKKLFNHLIPAPKGKSDWDDDHRFFIPEGFCNTTACLLGHAGLVKEFNDKGLVVEGLMAGTNEPSPNDIAEMSFSVLYKKSGNRYYDFEAGAEFFGISRTHASYLFSAGATAQLRLFNDGKPTIDMDKITPKGVARGLRKYVETDGKILDEYLNEGN